MSFSSSRFRPAPIGLAVVVAFACGRAGRASPEAAVCEPVGGQLAVGTTAAGWAGSYALTLVSTRGEQPSVEGSLTLRPQVDSLRGIMMTSGEMDSVATMPLIGVAEIALETVGALRLGNLMSADPTQPGVALVQRPGEITLRLGSDANLREMPRFDGGYLAMFVQHADSAGFAGTWASGIATRDAEGYFCAVRSN